MSVAAERPEAGLPDGFAVRLRDGLRAGAGLTLVGGTPLRAVRLSDRAAGLIVDGRVVVRDAASRVLADRLLETDLAAPEPPAEAALTAADVTVVVPVRDRADELDRLLVGLAPLAVLVVDDASRDRAAVARTARRHGARLVSLPVNLGPAGARNAGLAAVGTPVVAFVDCDVSVDPAALLALTGHLADPRVAAVAPRVRARSWSERPTWFERYDEACSSLDLGATPALVRPGGSVSYVPSACLLARTDALREAGGFDAALRVGEDVDLVWRLAGAGWRVRYDPTRQATHRTRGSAAGWLGRLHAYGTSAAPLAARHGDRVAPAALSPAYLVVAAALLAQRRWTPPVVAATTVTAAVLVHRALPEAPDRRRQAVRLAVRGVGWTVRQEADLILRHWWPAAAAASLVSPRARRAVAAALVVDWVVHEVVAPPRETSLPVALAGRRLGDLAYGAGVWTGALRARSTRALRPRLVRRPATAR